MTLYLIRTPWLANGNVSVFVEAEHEVEAADIAEKALTEKANADLAKLDQTPMWINHHAEQVESYRTREGWTVQKITLPWITEVT